MPDYKQHSHTHNRQTTMPPGEIRTRNPSNEQPQTHTLHRAGTGIGTYPLASHIIVENYPTSHLLSTVEW